MSPRYCAIRRRDTMMMMQSKTDAIVRRWDETRLDMRDGAPDNK